MSDKNTKEEKHKAMREYLLTPFSEMEVDKDCGVRWNGLVPDYSDPKPI